MNEAEQIMNEAEQIMKRCQAGTRDYFAAKAMQGFCASPTGMEWANHKIAAEAYAIADAMLKEREK